MSMLKVEDDLRTRCRFRSNLSASAQTSCTNLPEMSSSYSSEFKILPRMRSQLETAYIHALKTKY
jgi:hypothetical protein